MKFKGANKIETDKARFKLDWFIENEFDFELKRIGKHRTVKQNAYMHVIFKLYAIEYGCRETEAKTDLKRECGFMSYEVDRNGKIYRYLKETSKLDTVQMAKFIDWILIYTAQNGIFIPTAEQYNFEKFYFDKKIEEHKIFL